MVSKLNEEVLRSSFAMNGSRIFLVFDQEKGLYKLGSRWHWLATFNSIWDGCDAFEALELVEATGDPRVIAKVIRREIRRVPRHNFYRRGCMGRINYLINSTERRMQGYRPLRCGSKGAVEQWIPIAKSEPGV